MAAPGRTAFYLLYKRHFFFLALCFTASVMPVTKGENVNVTTSPNPGTSGDTGEESSERSTMARLMTYFQELPVTKSKVAPLMSVGTGKPKVLINITMAVVAVLSVNDVQQIMTTSGYVKLIWQDKALAWNCSHYGGLDTIEVPREWIWTPQIFVGNSMDFQNLLNFDGMLVIVASDGWALARTMITASTLCRLDLTKYPFNSQICPIDFISFSKHVDWLVNTIDDTTRSQEYSVGSEWELLSFKPATVIVKDYDEWGPQVMVEMRRKTTFYVVCLVLPMVLTAYMNTLVFLLPLQSGEKVSFLVSIFVSTSVFISYFTSVMPRGLDSVPTTMKLLISVIIEILIVLLATIVVIRRFHQQTTDAKEPDNANSPADSEGEGTRTALCCVRGPCVIAGRMTIEERSQKQTKYAIDAGRSSQTRAPSPRPTAEQMDNIFFVLSFVGNTICFGYLLSQSM